MFHHFKKIKQSTTHGNDCHHALAVFDSQKETKILCKILLKMLVKRKGCARGSEYRMGKCIRGKEKTDWK